MKGLLLNSPQNGKWTRKGKQGEKESEWRFDTSIFSCWASLMCEWDRCAALLLREPSLYTIVCWLISLHSSLERSKAGSSSFSHWVSLGPLLPAGRELPFSLSHLYLKAQTHRSPSFFCHYSSKCAPMMGSFISYILIYVKDTVDWTFDARYTNEDTTLEAVEKLIRSWQPSPWPAPPPTYYCCDLEQRCPIELWAMMEMFYIGSVQCASH